MGYYAKILAHSAGPDGQVLLTAEARFPRCVLAETVTHRACRDTFGEYEITASDRTTTEDVSKNSASSRAIPLSRMIAAVIDDPYVPERFSAAGPGMQGHGWLEGDDHKKAVWRWLNARTNAVNIAIMMLTQEDRDKLLDSLKADIAAWRESGDAAKEVAGSDLGRAAESKFYDLTKSVHKQDVNRLLEPWAWVTQILTADIGGWNNFWALRCDAMAHPAFQKVARMIYLAYRKSSSRNLAYGRWHLPFVDPEVSDSFTWVPPVHRERVPPEEIPDPIQFSAARCAWVSYENHDRDGTPEQMRRTFARLVWAKPLHASPVEHQATPAVAAAYMSPLWRSNLRGWIQARKLLAGERAEAYAPSEEEIASWGLGD